MGRTATGRRVDLMLLDRDVLKLRYVGERFCGRRLPVEVLGDLPAFRELVLSYAKDEWLARNRSRRRLPKGFSARLSFDLVAVEDGSAVPVMRWNREAGQATLPGLEDDMASVVDAALGHIADLFVGTASRPLSSDKVRALNRFGANLRPEESIEMLGSERDGVVVRLTPAIRKRLIAQGRDRYEAQLTDVGRLTGCVTRPEGVGGYILVLTDRHSELRVPMDNQAITEEFDGSIGQLVELDLSVALDGDDQVVEVVSVHNVDLVDEPLIQHYERCEMRLKRLSELEDGWRDGAGAAPSDKAVAGARAFLRQRMGLADLYRIFPTEEGGIQFEFVLGEFDFTIEFGADGAVDLFGIALEGSGSLELPRFAVLDAAFLAEFDKLVGRRDEQADE